MPVPLPDVDCPHCDSAETLSAVRAEPRGVRVCECSCCNANVRVNADGAVIHLEAVTDILGRVMTDP